MRDGLRPGERERVEPAADAAAVERAGRHDHGRRAVGGLHRGPRRHVAGQVADDLARGAERDLWAGVASAAGPRPARAVKPSRPRLATEVTRAPATAIAAGSALTASEKRATTPSTSPFRFGVLGAGRDCSRATALSRVSL